MNDGRGQLRRRWIDEQVGSHWSEMPASQDASFRSYHRLSDGERTLILMDAPPEHEDLGPFVAVARRLANRGVRVPAVLKADHDRGFLLLEDFGAILAAQRLDRGSAGLLYRQAADILAVLSGVETDGLPCYDEALQRTELGLFTEWFVARQLGRDPDADGGRWWGELCDHLVAVFAEQPQVFVHRDFHCGNLMCLADGELGVLDFQDAVAGPVTYDAASLIWDRYLSWSPSEIDAWSQMLHGRIAPQLSNASWRYWLDMTGLQRNLKVVGIFARLKYRDGKGAYLGWQPRFFDYIRATAAGYADLAPLARYLDELAATHGLEVTAR